ncbi:MAG: serine--tRNA ligase [Candidatus Pacebacteria bacterium]|nr:serine--tRNA ligase [Candidatus Paceibacterota bacterium]PIR63117.1 MAG: serine--tRNA ligase [Candidatus Pacebacteria bacterium CG10_big_fil_rev_8_21_14_0_10_40_26]PIZ78503.1 MAG: serine--tRNA ligase [Candidatus Pacebacteria bacterium CG_4_10_14_0_2_um_filter_40_20]PJA69353.1 MAG: serine--tRNA ligase [Candidatus Pacebacteria bacterium CG_4_9_14_3_um_filter_40_12]PJC41371.1 MAG: serine--tRNA ligase [Candidatus Pacebacteria bacterium CG_4_9_14_0_2_um_filter_40_15]
MLDIQFIRDNPEVVKNACKNKQLESSIIDELLAVDEKRRKLQYEVDNLRQTANQNADAVKKEVQANGKPSAELIANGKEIKTELQGIEPELKLAEEAFTTLMYSVPNVPADEVPIGKDEEGNVVVRTVGELPKLDFEPKQHHELMEALDLVDTVRAVRIGGFRSYFLKNEGLLLEQAILNYSLKLLRNEGFTAMSAPILVNKEAMEGTGYFPWGKEDHYKTQDGQILAGTAEVALTAYHMGETLSEADLPVKMVGISPCFRREVGTHGKDTQGIIRVHQFNKVEQVVYTIADEDETQKWHEKMTGYAEQLLHDLGLPYQVLLMCTGDMGAGQRKKYDIETWFPGQNKYRETHSASYFNDFQSRRLGIKYQAKDGTTKHVFTLNNTMAATPRLLAAVIENYQQADGSIIVPEVLQDFVGTEIITLKK